MMLNYSYNHIASFALNELTKQYIPPVMMLEMISLRGPIGTYCKHFIDE